MKVNIFLCSLFLLSLFVANTLFTQKDFPQSKAPISLEELIKKHNTEKKQANEKLITFPNKKVLLSYLSEIERLNDHNHPLNKNYNCYAILLDSNIVRTLSDETVSVKTIKKFVKETFKELWLEEQDSKNKEFYCSECPDALIRGLIGYDKNRIEIFKDARNDDWQSALKKAREHYYTEQ